MRDPVTRLEIRIVERAAVRGPVVGVSTEVPGPRRVGAEGHSPTRNNLVDARGRVIGSQSAGFDDGDVDRCAVELQRERNARGPSTDYAHIRLNGMPPGDILTIG